MAGYKLGQKVLLSNGTVKNIEDVQLGDSIYSFDIPEIITGIDFREIESLTLNVDNIQSPEVTNLYNEEGNYLQINELGVIDENVLAYHKNDKRYQFVSTIDLVINGEYEMVKMVDGNITHEPVVSKEIVYSEESLYNITLSGPSYYVLNGYIVHNIGYACIQDCITQSSIACIQNVYNFSVGDSFSDNINVCWEVIAVGGCAENCPTANISFIGSVINTYVGCDACLGGNPNNPISYEPGMDPGVGYDIGNLNDPCCLYLISCDFIEPECTCTYQYHNQYVKVTNLTPCPNAGQVVKLDNCDDCCYFIEGVVPDCEAIADCAATVYET